MPLCAPNAYNSEHPINTNTFYITHRYSHHHLPELLQCQPGHGHAEPVHWRQIDCDIHCRRRRHRAHSPRSDQAPVQRFRGLQNEHLRYCDSILYLNVGLRRLEQPELCHRRAHQSIQKSAIGDNLWHSHCHSVLCTGKHFLSHSYVSRRDTNFRRCGGGKYQNRSIDSSKEFFPIDNI